MVDEARWYFDASSRRLTSTQMLTVETRQAGVKFGRSLNQEKLEVVIEVHVPVKIVTYHCVRWMRAKIEITLYERGSEGEHACLEAS